jgi:hypothetical protein
LRTDTIIAIEVNSPQPIDTIVSDFSNANGYSTIGSGSYSNGFYALEINHEEFGSLGLQPKIDGRGSFLGVIAFNIIGNPQENDLANIAWSRSSFPGDVRVFDSDGNDIKARIRFVDVANNFTVVGVTLLSPNRDNLVIDRDATYKFLGKDYEDSGYPIYFERSVSPEKYIPINATPTNKNLDENLAYLFEYSLDGGISWFEMGRIAETDKTASASKANVYRSGEIAEVKSSVFNISTQTGGQINVNTFRRPVRVL